MPGPAPKNPATRQRRNKKSTAAKLQLVSTKVKTPALPKRERGDAWHPRTRAWWKAVWSSPMAPEYLESDRYELLKLAELEDAFHKAPSVTARLEVLKEIRLQRQAFGLTPIDRRRLEWEVERAEDAKGKRGKKATPAKPSKSKDPRAHLRAV